METILIVNAGSSSLAFVFTAGIGENSATMRARIADKLDWLGAALNPGGECGPAALLISRLDSRVPLYEIPTDEEFDDRAPYAFRAVARCGTGIGQRERCTTTLCFMNRSNRTP
jgi:hypothetical protein